MPQATRRGQLDAASERALVLRAQGGDPHARDELVEAFLPLIGSVARTYLGTPAVDRGDLMQDGVVGLLRALARFDPAMGTPFWGYASWWVRHSMQQLVAELGRPVVLSDRAVRMLAQVTQARSRFEQEHGGEPSSAQLGAVTGLATVQVDHLIVAARRSRGLEEPLVDDEDPHETLGGLLVDPQAEEAYEQVRRSLAVAMLPGLLERLTPRERIIVDARFGLRGPEQTLRQLGGRLGVSPERVRQLEQRALDKLHDAAGALPSD
jgi:RNA polymerase primary sigma factor